MVIGWLLVVIYGYCWLLLNNIGYWLVIVGYWLVIVGYGWLSLVIVGYCWLLVGYC